MAQKIKQELIDQSYTFKMPRIKNEVPDDLHINGCSSNALNSNATDTWQINSTFSLTDAWNSTPHQGNQLTHYSGTNSSGGKTSLAQTPSLKANKSVQIKKEPESLLLKLLTSASPLAKPPRKPRAPRKPRSSKKSPSAPTAEQTAMIDSVYWNAFNEFMYQHYYSSPFSSPIYAPYQPMQVHPSWISPC